MFIGHYGIALAAKRIDKDISLGTLFFATQFADILFFVLTLVKIERMSFAQASLRLAHLILPITHIHIVLQLLSSGQDCFSWYLE